MRRRRRRRRRSLMVEDGYTNPMVNRMDTRRGLDDGIWNGWMDGGRA